ncbi:MAG: hypothetical protein ACEQSL_09645, partial [Sediminibacterium sp.]
CFWVGKSKAIARCVNSFDKRVAGIEHCSCDGSGWSYEGIADNKNTHPLPSRLSCGCTNCICGETNSSIEYSKSFS